MVISAITVNGISTVELKHNKRYAVVSGKSVGGFPFYLVFKCIIKLIINKKPEGNRTLIIHN